jgi:hypothetical protein
VYVFITFCIAVNDLYETNPETLVTLSVGVAAVHS